MFGRFRKTNDPAAEQDAETGAVAVKERDEPAAAPAERTAPATERTAPATTAAPAAPAERTAPPTSATAVAAPVAPRGPITDDERAVREPRTRAPVVGEDTLVAMHARQRDRFGGIRWGSAFFGLLSAIGLAAILLGIVAAAGVATGVSEIKDVANGDAETIGLGGAILVLVVLALSWYCGGYVAGRMARFDGPRQGLGVWVWTVVLGAALAIAAVIGGSEYDVFQQLNLPNVAVGDQSLTTGGLITLAAALVVTLIFAVVGGKAGDIYHRRVDRFAAREYVEEPV